MTEYEGTALLPAGPATSQTVEPHELLARGEGVLVSWASGQGNGGSAWGPVLSGSSGLARSLSDIVRSAGAPRVAESAALFRVEVPAGQTLRDLVPAIGGGFRGMTRSGSTFTGQARLIPVAGTATGAAVALGPLVGLMALSVGAEMLARHQQEQQLKAIGQGVEALLKRQRQGDVAVLQTGEDALRRANAALLDRVRVPDSVGLAPAAHELSSLKNRVAQWLASWEAGVRQHEVDDKGLDIGRLKAMLGQPIDSSDDFLPAVNMLRQTVALDSRMRVLSAIEAATLNPDADLRHFRAAVQHDLEGNAALLERLSDTVQTFADYRITVGYPHRPKTASECELLASRLSRVAHVLNKVTTALPLLTEQNRLVIEAQRKADGTWSVRRPELTA